MNRAVTVSQDFASAPSPFKGEGWDGGEVASVRPLVFTGFTSSPALPRQGEGSQCVRSFPLQGGRLGWG